MTKSTLETGFATLWARTRGLKEHPPTLEYKFHPERRWKIDVAWPDLKIAVELEGGIFTKGGHTRGRGYSRNCEKYNALAMLNWTLLRYTTIDLDERPVQMIEEISALIKMKEPTMYHHAADQTNKPTVAPVQVESPPTGIRWQEIKDGLDPRWEAGPYRIRYAARFDGFAVHCDGHRLCDGDEGHWKLLQMAKAFCEHHANGKP